MSDALYDKGLVKEILAQILKATETVLSRSKSIKKVQDFTDSPKGMEKLDSICMLLIAIGESLKNIDKISKDSLLSNYPQIDWKGAKAMRDIISHHYFDVDAEIVYDVCKNKIAKLNKIIQVIINDIS